MEKEASTLLSSLNSQRRHVLGILDGLSDEDLLKPVLPSGWSCLGLVQHLAIDVEEFWFRQVVAAQVVVSDEMGDDPAAAWKVPAGSTPDVVLGRYRREIELADAIIAATPLDTEPVGWPDDIGTDWRLPDLRSVILHVITETACHAGHLDAARELIDGRIWLKLT